MCVLAGTRGVEICEVACCVEFCEVARGEEFCEVVRGVEFCEVSRRGFMSWCGNLSGIHQLQ